MAMNPLSYMEQKLKATKIITVNNTPDQRISSKTPFEHTPRVTIPPEKMPVSMCRFALHIAQKHLAAGFCPELLGELTALPRPPNWLKGKGGKGKGEGNEGKEGIEQ